MGSFLVFLGDAEDEDRKRQEEQFVVGPGGTTTPRAWTGWRSGQETEKRRRKWGEQQVSLIYIVLVPCEGNCSFVTSQIEQWRLMYELPNE